MKCFKSLFFLGFIVMFALPVHAQVELVKQSSQDVSLTNGTSEDLARLIVGTWKIGPNKYRIEGPLVFNGNGTYEMNEKWRDGTGGGTKGQFRLNAKASPATLDLCLDKCGNEWTTRFCIIRGLPDEKLEIQVSPGGKYPTGFSREPSGEHTMILSR